MGIIKCKFDAEFDSVAKWAKNHPEKSYRQTTVALNNKSQKLHFSVTFSLKTFFAWDVLQPYYIFKFSKRLKKR
jgi:hypothetical protein